MTNTRRKKYVIIFDGDTEEVCTDPYITFFDSKAAAKAKITRQIKLYTLDIKSEKQFFELYGHNWTVENRVRQQNCIEGLMKDLAKWQKAKVQAVDVVTNYTFIKE